MQSKTILITGGAGFIGSHLADKLLQLGIQVVVLDNFNTFYDPGIKEENVAHNLDNPSYSLIKGDIRSAETVSTLFNKHSIDTVVHLAARAGVRPSLEQPELYYDANVMGTLNLLEQMRQVGCRHLILASSSSVYGNREQGPFRETDNTDQQVSPYGASKKSAELLCHTYAHLYSINTTCLRFFTVYGPRNRPDMACHLFTDAIYQGKELTQYGDGTTGRDYTYIDDTISGIVSAIKHPKEFEIVNLGNSSPVLLKELIQTIEQVVGKKAKIKKAPIQPGDVKLTYADISKAKKIFDYQPSTSFHRGIRQLYNYYLKHLSK